jgi:Glycosyltransferase family 87
MTGTLVEQMISGSPSRPRWRRNLTVSLLILVVLLGAALFALAHPQHDFLEYWTASHLVLAHKNPYSLPEMFQSQKELGWPEPTPVMFVCPPWTLPLLVPLGLAGSYALGWLAWMAVLVAAIALSSRLLMDIYFGDIRLPEISDSWFYRCLFAFTFYPVLLCLKFAQTAPLILLGLVGFLYFERRQRPVLAGVLLSLTAVKPQLLFLVWIALAVRSLHQRRWLTLASAAGVLAAFSGIALLLDPRAFSQYSKLTRGPYLPINPSGITAMIRRTIHSGGISRTYWMQFVPPFVGMGWLAYYWRKHRDSWNWPERMPALVTACMLTTAYGWIFDQTVLVVAVIAVAAQHAKREGHLPWNLVMIYTALNCGLMLLMAVPPLTFIPAPILLVWLLSRERSRTVFSEVAKAC